MFWSLVYSYFTWTAPELIWKQTETHLFFLHTTAFRCQRSHLFNTYLFVQTNPKRLHFQFAALTEDCYTQANTKNTFEPVHLIQHSSLVCVFFIRLYSARNQCCWLPLYLQFLHVLLIFVNMPWRKLRIKICWKANRESLTSKTACGGDGWSHFLQMALYALFTMTAVSMTSYEDANIWSQSGWLVFWWDDTKWPRGPLAVIHIYYKKLQSISRLERTESKWI